MKLATTLGDFRTYCDTYEERVKHVCEAGFRYLDLDLYAAEKNDALLISENWKESAAKLKAYAEGFGATFVQAHSPGGNPLSKDGSYDSYLKATIRSIEVCGEMGIPNTVVHAGMLPGISKEEYFSLNREFFRQLFPAMEKYGVNVLCENSTKANMGQMYFTNSGKDMREFIEYVDHPLFHACWDTGHANCEGAQYEQIMTLGDEIYAIHVHDNSGRRDEHLIPYSGIMNMDDLMHALIDSGYKGYFTFEASSSLRPDKYWLGNRISFDRDERLLKPQLFMQKQIEKLMYDMGVYILKQYDLYED